ncbi:MAG: hypothetical protein ACQCN6_00620 [Candidatus Bathyarchaeia archaeon]|jgi:hypothetical protein
MTDYSTERLLLVGDNPFLSISHLSQQKVRERTENPGDPEFASHLLRLALKNGANGFTFSVCDSNFSILQKLNLNGIDSGLDLFPVVPYAFEYVQKATQHGGISNLVKKLGWDMIKSGDIESLFYGVLASATANPPVLMKAYLSYELSRLSSVTSKKIRLHSVLLHQLVTDMALALGMDWLFKDYVIFLNKKQITPGFNTGNFAYLVDKFREWEIDLSKVLILAPFNKVGFQMMPSIKQCEESLSKLSAPSVIAMSVLAAGYVTPSEAVKYLADLPNIKGVAVGVSKEKHAIETFSLLKKEFLSIQQVV